MTRGWNAGAAGVLMAVLVSATGGCDREVPGGEESGAAAAPPHAAVDEDDVEAAVRLGTKGLNYLVSAAAKEDATHDAQKTRLDAKVDVAREHIVAGRLDEAELELVDLRWSPVTSAHNATDKLLVEQYDQQREALRAVIDRKRAAAP